MEQFGVENLKKVVQFGANSACITFPFLVKFATVILCLTRSETMKNAIIARFNIGKFSAMKDAIFEPLLFGKLSR